MRIDEIREKNLSVIPDKILVFYGGVWVKYNLCFECGSRFKYTDYEDEVLCSYCASCVDDLDVPESNISPVYYENIVGCEVNVPLWKNGKKMNYKKCLIRDEMTCQYCGWNVFMGDDKNLMVDNVIPFTRDNALINLKCCCDECFTILKNKIFDSYFDKKDYLLKVRNGKGMKDHYYRELSVLKNKVPFLFNSDFFTSVLIKKRDVKYEKALTNLCQ